MNPSPNIALLSSAMVLAACSPTGNLPSPSSDTQIKVSPDKQFTITSNDSELHIVAVPSQKTGVADRFDSDRLTSVVWSNNRTYVACSEDLGRFRVCLAFQRRGDSFTELHLPELELPTAVQSRVYKWIGQHATPTQWHGTNLMITTTGLALLSDKTSLRYSYEYTISFDDLNAGKVVKVRELNYEEIGDSSDYDKN